MSIFRLVNSSNVENSDKELGALADLLLGSDSRTKINEIEKLLDKLGKDKKIIRKKNFWIKFRK
jgi:hypothetical protein